MSKWMSGCLIVFALIALAMWWGYLKVGKFASGEQAVAVGIRAPAARVFASLANADSIRTWMAQGNRVTIHRRGMLVVGDTLRIEPRSMLGVPQRDFIWTVTEVKPSSILALQMRNDTTGRVMAVRRDSLATKGDSTIVVSSVVSAGTDSLRIVGGDSVVKAEPDMPSRLLVSMFRLESQLELMRLKERIEGRPAPRR